MFLTRTLFESIVPAICGLFIGSWSDHYGRKPLLIVSMVGRFSNTIFLELNILYLLNILFHRVLCIFPIVNCYMLALQLLYG